MKRYFELGAPAIVLLLWDLSLAFPMNRLQEFRVLLLGHAIPLYYFFVVCPIMFAAGLNLATKRNWDRWEILWWLLPLICLPGLLYSADPLWSIRQWLSLITRGILPGAILFSACSRKKSNFRALSLVYPVIIASALFGLAELYFGHNPIWDSASPVIPTTNDDSNPFYRPHDRFALGGYLLKGTQGNRIPYASTLVAFFPFGIWSVKYAKKHRWVYLIGLILLLFILIAARARSAWAGLLAAMVLLPVIGLQRNLKEFMAVVVGLMVVIGGLLIWPKTQLMLLSRLHSLHSSDINVQARLEMLSTLSVLRKRWLTGIGYGEFPYECKSYYHGKAPWGGTPDDQYLRWVIENGTLSFGLLVAFCSVFLLTGLMNIHAVENHKEADMYRSIFMGWVSVAVTFLFFDGFYWGACNMTFWCLLGLFSTCIKTNKITS